MTTPMRRQYLSLKAQHPDCVLFFRLGDFYETFDDDAKILAKVCDVVLTSRPTGKEGRVPLAGVPHHSVDGHIAKLIDAGYRVAIAEQITEPGNGLVERQVRRVVTRGTVVEPEMLDAKRNSYLMAVAFDPSHRTAGIAFCDITTGEFAATQVDNREAVATERCVGEEMGRLQPREFIPAAWKSADLQSPGLQVQLDSTWMTTAQVEPWQVELETATDSLLRHFDVASLDGFGLGGKPQAVRAAAALLAYLREMQPGALAQLTTLHHYSVDDFMTLDESTRRNLELTETIRGGQVKGSLLDVIDCTLTPMGGRLLRRWLCQPLLDVDQINARLDRVSAFHDGTQIRLELREILKEIGDLERWTNRVRQGVALPKDLVGIREVLARVPDIKRIMNDEWVPIHHSLFIDLPECKDVTDLLDRALAEEPPASMSNPGVIAEGFSEELDGLVEKSRGAKEWIANLEATERERLDVKSLKVGYNKVFGYYIEITHTHREKVPEDYIRKQTLTSAERYITPDLKEYESLVLHADEQRLDIEQRLFKEVCAQVASATPRLLKLAAGLAEIDVFAALAEVALTRRYVRPTVDEGPGIEIRGGRHPVVELTLTDEPFVPNETHLAPETALQIITGPNMSGKSTYLRQTALVTLLAQIGSFVPADSAQIGVVDRIFTRIGASDEIHRGQSTFMVEMVETANILNHATRRSLLVLDEIGRGTSTYDGMAIAWAVVEYIHNHPDLRAKTLFATHYHELTDLAERLPHVVNYHVAVDDSGDTSFDGSGTGTRDVVFLRRILPGRADRSYGVHVAQMAGLPSAAVHRAQEILADLEASGAAGPQRLLDDRVNGTKPAARQVTLFAEAHPAVEALRSMDVNGLTPLDALNRLFELQQLAREDG